jgi:hypothetical protein
MAKKSDHGTMPLMAGMSDEANAGGRWGASDDQ